MIDVIVWAWLVFVLAGAGLLVLPRRLWDSSPALRLALGFGLGAGLLIAVTFVAGMSGTLHGLGKWGILPLGTVLACGGWWRCRSLPMALARDLFRERSWFEVVLWAILIGLVGKNFLAALTPEVRHDALDYHIQFSNLYAVKGGITDEPWSVMSYLPFNMEMLYTLTLLWAGDSAAKLLHFTFGVVAVLATIGLGKRWYRRSVGLFAAVLFYLQPQVAMISNTCFNDLGRAAFETMALALWFELWNAGRNGNTSHQKNPIVFLVVFAGLALGVKWATFPIFFGPLLVVHTWFFVRNRPSWRRTGEILLLFLVPLILFLPWCYRSYRFTGNPVYPALNGRFGLTDPVSRQAEAFFQGHAPAPETYGIPEIFAYWGDRFRDVGLAGSVLVYLLLVIVPLAALAWWVSPARKQRDASSDLFVGLLRRPTPANLSLWYLVFAILGFLLLTYNADGRFLLPTYPIMALFVALSISSILGLAAGSREGGNAEATESPLASRPLLPLVLILALVANSVYHQINAHHDLREPWLPILGQAREEFWKARYPLLPVLDGLPSDALVLGVGFPARVPYIWKMKVGRNVVEERIDSRPYEAKDLYDALRELGVTHVVEPSAFPLWKDAFDGLKERYAVLVAEAGEHRLYLLKTPELLDSTSEP
jgi:hypothetical protein